MSDAVPSRAAAALSPVFPLVLADGRRLPLGPFTLRRELMLYTIESPLHYDGARYGLPFGWAATLRILAEPDAAALSRELALDGPAEFVAGSLDWFEAQGLSLDDLGEAVSAIKAEWRRLSGLDRPDGPKEDASTAMGEACGPGTASSPNSSAMPSTPGTGAPTKPSTAPSASSSSPSARSDERTAPRAAASAGPS